MNLIDRIDTEADLKSVRDHIASVLADKMSLPMGAAKANERVAWMLGARDWNTALGMVNNRVLAPQESTHGVNNTQSQEDVETHNVVRFLLALSGDPELNSRLSQAFLSRVFEALDDWLLSMPIPRPVLSALSGEPELARQLREVVSALMKSGNIGTGFLDKYLLDNTGLHLSHLVHTGSMCIKCESGLDVLGFCEDETCAHSDYGQQVTKVLQGKVGWPRRKIIRATMETDDGHRTVEFDATPYFIHKLVTGSMEKTINDLKSIDWARGEAADDVALFFEDQKGFDAYREYRELKEAFSYNASLPVTRENKDICGFEVFVECGDLEFWLSDHHPILAKRVNAD